MVKLISFVYHEIFSRVLPNIFFLLRRELRDCNTVLDLGCGSNSPLRIFSKGRKTVGVDIFKPSIEMSKKRRIHNKYICEDIIKMKIKPKSYDCIMAMDFIEHVKKRDGIKLLKKMEEGAKKKVIVFTPRGFVEQDAHTHDRAAENKHQEHLSGWEVEEMRKRGYKVYGTNGLTFLRDDHGRIRIKPDMLGVLISDLTQPLVINNPDKAFHIFCVKDIK